ncbi:hypothetical protein ACE1BS_23445, partial [Aeromonas jandaei]
MSDQKSEQRDKIVSTAFNFQEHYDSMVDMRTGMYKLNISVGQIFGSGGMHISLKLFYNILSLEDAGFGYGWRLNLTRYDRALRRLTLSDGSNYVITRLLSEGEITSKLQYLKLNNLMVFFKANKITIYHKDGTQELLDENGRIQNLVAPSGHQFTFKYGFGNRLISITDSAGKQFRILYESGITRFMGMGNDSTVSIRISSKKELNKVMMPHNLNIGISYKIVNGISMIEYVYHPTGATEKITYDPYGMKLALLPK